MHLLMQRGRNNLLVSRNFLKNICIFLAESFCLVTSKGTRPLCRMRARVLGESKEDTLTATPSSRLLSNFSACFRLMSIEGRNCLLGLAKISEGTRGLSIILRTIRARERRRRYSTYGCSPSMYISRSTPFEGVPDSLPDSLPDADGVT